MKSHILVVLSIITLAAGMAFAHGNKKHVVGTVDRINANSVIVRTTEGKSVEVKLVSSTIYILRSGNTDNPAKMSDLAVGDKVIIHATPAGETLSADEVKFSVPSLLNAPSKPSAKSPQ